jgi:hypothetical protein
MLWFLGNFSDECHFFSEKSKQKPLSVQYISISRRRIRRDTSKPNFFIGGNMMDTEKMEEGKVGISGTNGKPDNHVYLFLSKGMMGKVRFDVSVNYPTLEESKKVLSQAIDVVQQLIAEKVLPSAGRKETSQRHRFYSE